MRSHSIPARANIAGIRAVLNQLTVDAISTRGKSDPHPRPFDSEIVAQPGAVVTR
jgi:hypothetical protein